MQLSEIIIDKIRKNGAISFHDFMEMSLYYPELGYYTAVHDTIGRRGDYYTSCTLTPAFGAMVGRQLEEMWRLLGEEKFTIVEHGAGPGMLCRDILAYLQKNEVLYQQLNYCIVEKSPAMREQERTCLPDKVSWHETADFSGGISGCIISNELVDNFAVHRVVMREELMEIYVDFVDGFTETLRPASDELKTYLDELGVTLPRGFHTEINLQATEWIKAVAKSLKRGYVITIDYGFPSTELYRDHRKGGTLVCYHKHVTNDYLYHHIGEQDITAHVNFSALHHWGAKHGLQSCGYTDQAHFLMSLGIDGYFTEVQKQAAPSLKNYLKAISIKETLLGDMGSRFKVLMQQKGMPNHPLSGLKLSPYKTAAYA